MARFSTASNILNQVAVECGLSPETDPYSSTNDAFIQLQYLLNTAGIELVMYNEWQALIKEYNFTTDTATYPDGEYALPSDYAYMIDQTGWNRSQDVPIGGPFTAQDWAYATGRGLNGSTIYASFRVWENLLQFFPEPPQDAQDISFQYMGRNWIAVTGSTDPTKDAVTVGTDVVLFEPILIQRYLKTKFLDVKGFDTTSSQADFDQIYKILTGKDTGARIVNAGNAGRGYPYLDNYRNTPDTNFGS